MEGFTRSLPSSPLLNLRLAKRTTGRADWLNHIFICLHICLAYTRRHSLCYTLIYSRIAICCKSNTGIHTTQTRQHTLITLREKQMASSKLWVATRLTLAKQTWLCASAPPYSLTVEKSDHRRHRQNLNICYFVSCSVSNHIQKITEYVVKEKEKVVLCSKKVVL